MHGHRPTLAWALAFFGAACAETSADPASFRFAAELPDGLPAACVGEDYAFALEVIDPEGRIPTWAAEGLPPGITLQADGPRARLSGAPTTTGDFRVRVEVSAGEDALSASFDLVVVEPLRVTTATLAAGRVGRGYEAQLAASGGRGPRAWAARGLPRGLRLSSEGRLAGTPEEAGRFELDVEVRSPEVEKSAGARIPLEITAASPLALAPESVDPETGVLALPAGVVGRPYDASILAAGGVAPLEWRAAGLPPGLTLGASGRAGAVSGRPAQEGVYEGTVTVTDAAGAEAQVTLRILIVEPLSIRAGDLTRLPTCARVAHTLRAAGGSGQGLAWSVASGRLPSGLSLEGTGVTAQLTGVTGTAPERAQFAIEARDSLGLVATSTFSIEVDGDGPPPDRYFAFTARLEVEETGVFVLDRCRADGPTRVSTTDVGVFSPGPGPTGIPQGLEIDRAGDRIAFVGADPMDPTRRAVFLADLRGGPRPRSARVVLGGRPLSPKVQFSPDGAWLAITEVDRRSLDQIGDLWIADVSDPASPSPAELLTSALPLERAANAVLRFSPDSTRIAYRAEDTLSLYVRALTRPAVGMPMLVERGTAANGGVFDFVWTRDARGVVYIVDQEPFFADLSLPAPIRPARVLDPIPQRASGFRPGSLVLPRFGFSPSGDRLQLAGARDLASGDDVLVVEYANGAFGAPRVLGRAPGPASGIVGASWSPRGDRLAFVRSESGGFTLHVVDAGGGPASPPVQLPDTRLRNGDVLSPGWLCDGDVLVFRPVESADGAVLGLALADLTAARPTPTPVHVAPLAGRGVESFRVSPDGRSVAFSQGTRPNVVEGFVVEDVCAGGRSPVRLHAPFTTDNLLAWPEQILPIWSSDSRALFMLGHHREEIAFALDLFVIPVGGGGPYASTLLVGRDPDILSSSLNGLTVQGLNRSTGR